MSDLVAAEAAAFDDPANDAHTVGGSSGALETTPSAHEKKGKAEAVTEQHDEHVIPDGGLRAWATVVGAWLVSACAFGYVNAYGVYQSYYIQTYLPSYSASAISWIGSLQMFGNFAVGVVAGPLFDAGYSRHLMISGTVIYVGSLFAQSAAHQDSYYQIFLSQAIGQGLAQGLIYLPAFAAISHHFQKKRGLAMGIAVTGSSVGGIVFPVMINNLFETVGYTWAVRACGFFMLGALGLANVLITTRPHPGRKGMAKPKISALATDAPYVVAILGVFLIGLGIFFVFFYMQVYAETIGLSQSLSFYTLAIINGASVLGRTIPNLVVDKTGVLTILIPMSFITAALVLAILGLKTAAPLIVYCILYGFFSGAYVSLLAPMFAAMADNVSEMGIRMGLAFGIVGIGALIGTPIDGALLGSGPHYAWWKAAVFSCIVMFAGCGCLAAAWHLLGKKRNKRWV